MIRRLTDAEYEQYAKDRNSYLSGDFVQGQPSGTQFTFVGVDEEHRSWAVLVQKPDGGVSVLIQPMPA